MAKTRTRPTYWDQDDNDNDQACKDNDWTLVHKINDYEQVLLAPLLTQIKPTDPVYHTHL